ncbi:MAG: hypothetical protein ABEH43_00395, partial [Flavobacteriales bacterium]
KSGSGLVAEREFQTEGQNKVFSFWLDLENAPQGNAVNKDVTVKNKFEVKVLDAPEAVPVNPSKDPKIKYAVVKNKRNESTEQVKTGKQKIQQTQTSAKDRTILIKVNHNSEELKTKHMLDIVKVKSIEGPTIQIINEDVTFHGTTRPAGYGSLIIWSIDGDEYGPSASVTHKWSSMKSTPITIKAEIEVNGMRGGVKTHSLEPCELKGVNVDHEQLLTKQTVNFSASFEPSGCGKVSNLPYDFWVSGPGISPGGKLVYSFSPQYSPEGPGNYSVEAKTKDNSQATDEKLFTAYECEGIVDIGDAELSASVSASPEHPVGPTKDNFDELTEFELECEPFGNISVKIDGRYKGRTSYELFVFVGDPSHIFLPVPDLYSSSKASIISNYDGGMEEKSEQDFISVGESLNASSLLPYREKSKNDFLANFHVPIPNKLSVGSSYKLSNSGEVKIEVQGYAGGSSEAKNTYFDINVNPIKVISP